MSVTEVGIGRVLYVDCLADKQGQFNGHFTITGTCWDGDRVRFTQIERPDWKRGYRTVFGPFFWHKAQVYQKSADSFNKALLRLTCSREAVAHRGVVYTEEVYRQSQRNFSHSRIVTEYIRDLRSSFHDRVRGTDPLVEMYEYAHAPHPKRAERIKAYEWLVGYGRVGDRTGHARNPQVVTCKLKEHEWNCGKIPRVIIDLTALCAVLCGWFIERLKSVFSEHTSKYNIKFVPGPEQSNLEGCFRDLQECRGGMCFRYFSDDACLSVACRDGVYRCNLDISSCDASNGGPIFKLLQDIVKGTGLYSSCVRQAVDQCRLPTRAINPDDRRERVTMVPHEPVEYSGSVLTTCLNNVASSLIGLALASVKWNQVSISDCEAHVRAAAARAGYAVKCQRVDEHQQFQFLKHSPTERGEVFLNLGVILRTLGSCKGDLPGKSKVSLEYRGYQWNCAIMQSCVHAGSSRVTQALRQAFPPKGQVVVDNWLLAYRSFYRDADVSDQDLCARYGCTTSEITQLSELIRGPWYGRVIRTPLTDKIYQMDYAYDE